MQITINRRTIEIGIAVLVVLMAVMWIGSDKAPENVQQDADSAPQEILKDLNSATPKAKPTVQKTTPPPPPASAAPAAGAQFKDYKNGTYVLSGNSITLINGKSASGKTEILSAYEASGDLNADKIYDAAFVIRQTIDEGVFYYLAAVIKNNNGYRATNTILLGQSITPQSIGIGTGDIGITYLDRNSGEPLSVIPSLQRYKSFRVVSGVLKAR